MTQVLADLASERALLASMLLAPAIVPRILAEEKIRAEHFYLDQHRAVFAAIINMLDRGENPDEITLAVELKGTAVEDPRALLIDIYAAEHDTWSARSYARIVREMAHRRKVMQASHLLAEAATTGDMTKREEADALLTSPLDAEATTWAPERLRDRFADRLDSPMPDTFPWPFRELNKWSGGLRRQQVVLIGGWTSNGKSVLYDQILDHLAEHGLRVHSYINEMSEEERMDRTMARLSGVKFGRIHSRDLAPEENVELRRSLTRVNVGITECAGWTALEIARHIRWNRWDVAGVDIVHEIEHHDERDLAEVARVLRITAKSVGCILICCVHLNDQRVTSPQRPVPVLRDIRGTGMLSRGADVVLFVHREDDEDGVPMNTGSLFAAKIRNGQPNAMKIIFDPDRMRFLPATRDLAVVA